MPIGAYISGQSLSAKQYADVLRQLEAAGAGSPKGRLYHAAFGDTNDLQVFDVWNSQADLDAFTAILMPILEKNGVKPATPAIMPIHNIIEP